MQRMLELRPRDAAHLASCSGPSLRLGELGENTVDVLPQTQAPVMCALVAALTIMVTLSAGAQSARVDAIPLPEHPRPDFERTEWINLNGRWRFAFDKADRGERLGWMRSALPGTRDITVPFSWGSPSSGVPDSADIGWYSRTIAVPEAWRGKRVFVVFGASDWQTAAWVDGQPIGTHQGGYTPFSFELTGANRTAGSKRLTVRVNDAERPFKLEGKQGYGKARGMWQTVYLEARGSAPIEAVHYTPRADLAGVGVDVRLREPAPRDLAVRLQFTNRPGQADVTARVNRGASALHLDVPLPDARRWSLDDPFLHDVVVTISGDGVSDDRVQTYFGMRTVSAVNLPGTEHPYVAINGTPVYLQIALDQAYHPDGFYTFPTDSILRNEILLARQIGLNALREHIKIEAPRKLYWADKLGILIMADVPNWWGQPDSAAFREHETAMRGMFDRDWNHPSVFSYVLFNETWGLFTKVNGKDQYTPATQRKVASVYRLAKSLDPTRLIEDNSICCGSVHTETDLNTWHEYLPGWRWESYVKQLSDSTYTGSPYHFAPGYTQGRQPMLNSEFGNVWGYKGSTGDVDWSWDYRRAIDVFRRYPKIAGWLYTEHHDVINEWNGYWRFDRTWKDTGFGDLVPGMTLRDLHAPLYVAVGDSLLSHEVSPGTRVDVPLYASFLTASTAFGDSLTLRAELSGVNTFGEHKVYSTQTRRIPYTPWMSSPLAPLSITMPDEAGVAVLGVRLEDNAGTALHRNFTTYVVGAGVAPDSGLLTDGSRVRATRVGATQVRDARWSRKQWTVLGNAKFNGAGSGFVEYRLPWPTGLRAADVATATFLVEASAKRLNGKDRDSTQAGDGDYMRGGGLQDRSQNTNSYPMTSAYKYPSAVTIRVNGAVAAQRELADDPADSRGILSWNAQRFDGTLTEAGSYGELLRIPLSAAALATSASRGEIVIRMEVSDALPGGLAIYGARFGRYPIDPTVLFVLKR
jgi:Glycosyl hydrolases family 2, sugar binding domain/Glycosyl hydrolases family 2, TIM barrel domain/Glycosyl hydrolases family 2